MSYPYTTSRTLTISDNEGTNTWRTAVSLNNGAASTIGDFTDAIIYANNIAAGTQQITFTFDAAIYDFQIACKEAYHISAGASIVDGTSTNGGLVGPLISSGSFTTTSSGDLIFQYGQWDNSGRDLNEGSQGVTGFAAGSGWSKIDANTMTGQFFQNIQQTTAGAITPSYDVEALSGGIASSFSTVAAAFETDATKGAAPPQTGIHIDHETTVAMVGGNNPTIEIPADGNFLTITATATGNTFAAHDSEQNSYTESEPGNESALLYATASTVNVSQKIVVTNTGGNNAEFVVRDIRGVATSSPIDTTASAEGPQTSFAAGATITGAPSGLTPAASGELVIFAMQVGCGPPQYLSSPSGSVTDSVWYTGQTDADSFDYGEGHAHLFTTNTSTLSGTWVMQNTTCGANYWGVAAWAIKHQ